MMTRAAGTKGFHAQFHPSCRTLGVYLRVPAYCVGNVSQAEYQDGWGQNGDTI